MTAVPVKPLNKDWNPRHMGYEGYYTIDSYMYQITPANGAKR